MKRKYWTKKEEKYLIDNFSDIMNNELSKTLNKTEHSIHMKAYKLKLKKSNLHKSKMIGKRNKMVGRDLSYDLLKAIAKKYKSKGEFQKYDHSAYSCARTMGCLDEICSHMIKCQYSIPQLILGEIIKMTIDNKIIYDSRKIIKPYELDIFIPKYNLAFEYDGKGWHTNNDTDKIKNDLCIHKNIKLIRIIENNRKYSEDIKNQLINKLDDINNYCKLNIQKEDILNIDDNELYNIINKNLLDIDDIKDIILKYNDYKSFMKTEIKLYSKLVRTKRLDLLINLKKSHEMWTDLKVDEEISKYVYLTDFIKNSNKCYNHIKKNKLEYKIDKLKRINMVWSIDSIKNMIIKYDINKISKLKKLYPGAINFLRRKNEINYIKEYMKNI